MELSTRQRRALEDICDTFCPSGEGLPSARELDVADTVVEAVAANPRAAERKQFAALLSAWDSYAFGALGGGSARGAAHVNTSR
jgi:long-chain-alcohol oxidase